MKKSLSVLLILAFSSASLDSAAQCVTVAEAKLDADCVVMPFGEQRGVWFRLDKAEELRRSWVELPEQVSITTKLEELVKIREKQRDYLANALATSEASADLSESERKKAVNAALLARAERDAAEAEMARWYRNPFALLGAGFALGVLSTVIAALAIK